MAASDSAPEATDGGPATGEALLVALAILALIVAAFALPPLSPGAAADPDGENGDAPAVETPEPTTSTPTETTETGTPTDEVVRVIEGDGEGRSGDGGAVGNVSSGPTTEPHPDCFVVVWDRLVPGDDATILVWNDEAYVQRTRVWFDNRSIGTTGRAGLVRGRVPYRRTIDITAAVPPVDACHFLHLRKRQDYRAYVEEHGERPTIVVADPGAGQTPTDGTVSASFPVRGQTTLRVRGDPYPGEPVEIHASVADVPMRDATVSVDGQRVGATDAAGNATVRIPDGGQETVEVSVERGDFRATERVEIWLLAVAIKPEGLLAMPGGSATVVARVAGRPAADVAVSLDGKHLGTTDADGTVRMALPADLGATVIATGAHAQTVRAPIWPHYVFTALVAVFAFGLVAISVLGVARTDAGPTWRRVAAGWIAVGAVLIAWIGWGPRAAAAVVGVLGLAGGALVAIRRRAAIEQGVSRAVDRVRHAGPWIRRTALRAATVLSALAERIPSGLQGVLAAIRLAVAAAIARLRFVAGWLRRRPARLPATIGRLLSRLRRDLAALRREYSSRWVLLAAFGSGLVVLGAAWYAEAEGAIGATVAVVAAGLFAWWRRAGEDATTEASGLATDTESPAVAGAAGTRDESEPSLRELWRTFARWVVPGQWRTRTPGEIARSAIDRGFPEGPVRRLTAVFREVEYGDRRLSADKLERARAAFDALRDREDEEAAD